MKLRGYLDLTKFEMKPLPILGALGKKTPENNWTLPEVDLRSKDVSTLDLSDYDMQDVTFDEQTKWAVDLSRCPKGYNQLNEIIELGKNPGLGIRSLHEKGIDGTGVSMAIIDQPLSDHMEYRDNIVHYEEIGYGKNELGSMHGAAVASIAVGKNCGVAPKAKLYYFAAENIHKDEKSDLILDKDKKNILTAIHYANALKRILQINEMLPENEKIHIVSVSWGQQGKDKTLYSAVWDKILERARRAGLFVLTTASRSEYGLGFSGMGKKVISNPDQLSSYCDDHFGPPKDIVKKWSMWNEDKEKESLLVPMNHRTLASPTGQDKYVHYSHGGWSWATPWLAGMFVLARQVNPNITPQHFWEVGGKTGKKSDILESCDNGFLLGKIIQPQKLIDVLQKEREIGTVEKTVQNVVNKTIKLAQTKGVKNER